MKFPAAPETPDLLQKAQNCTEDFAAAKGIFEGLYIATPSTYVLTFSNCNYFMRQKRTRFSPAS